ncbi:MAG: hypothetical protein NTY22_00980 [Proteobacteria bacterium]|nr:hypothetical protein [Pseudomonadota bacterium]
MINFNLKSLFRKSFIIFVSVFSLLYAACGNNINIAGTNIFTNPANKISDTASDAFTQQLYSEALAYEPLLGQSGTQVHMGYWSGKGNHGDLVRVLDAINASTAAAGQATNKAIWDEGAQTSLQYPSYIVMTFEHWYERGSAVDGKVTIFGVQYTDPFPVTFAQADQIWGQYSQRYGDTARLFYNATGNVVQVWCFVNGAKANRIFFTYEYPELVKLEAEGVVSVHFAKTDLSDWTVPSDWTDGTANAPTPL